MMDDRMDDRALDARLRTALGGVKQRDVAETPAFGPMIARARAAAASTDATSPVPTAGVPIVRRRFATRRLVAWGGPLLVAAGLGSVWFVSDRMKDREFERAVAEWSASETALQSPTDQLLVIPGSEFLGRLPALERSAGRPSARRGS